MLKHLHSIYLIKKVSDKLSGVSPHLLVVRLKKLSTEYLVFRQEILEGREGIGGNVECGDLHVREKSIKLFRLQDYLGQGLVSHTLSKHRPTVQRNLLIFIPTG